MQNANKSREQLLDEQEKLRRHVGQLEAAEKKHQQAARDLRDAQTLYASLVENIPAAILRKDTDGWFTYANARFVQTLGRSLDRILGKTDSDFYPAHLAEKYRQDDLTVMESGEVFEAVEEHVLKDGSKGHVNVLKSPLHSSEGELVGVQAIFWDVTERERSRNLLHAQREMAEKLSATNALDDGLRLCVETALEVSALDCAGVYLVDEATGALDMVFHKGLPEGFVRSASHYPPDSPNARLVLAGNPTYSQHKALGVPLNDSGQREGLRAIAILPMHHEGRVVGCLNIASHALDEVPEFARVALETIAASIGSAVARLRTEDALRESEERYRLFAENVSDVIWTTDLELNATYVSPSVFELRGYTAEEAMAQSFEKRLTPESAKLAQRLLAEERATADEDRPMSRTFNLEFNCKDGSTVLAETNVSLLYDTRGRPTGLLGVSRDISERRRAEEVLRKSEAQYRLLAENASDVIWTMDLELNITYVSPSVTELRGYTVEEVKAQSLEERLAPASLLAVIEAFAQRPVEAEGGRSAPVILELESKRKDGSTVLVETSITDMRDAGGQLVGMLGVSRDISERRRAEAALRESEEQFRTVVEQSTSAIEIYEPDGEMLLANDAWARFWNLKKEDVADFNIFDDPQCEATGLTPAFREAQQGRSRMIPETAYDPDESGFMGGRVRWISARMYPIKDQAGKVQNIVLTYDDVTERRKAEDERLNLERQVQQAQKLESLGVLAGGIAHDFNNILMAVLGYADLAIGDLSPTHPARESVQEIEKGAKRAADLTRQMLAYSGRGKFVIEEMDVSALMDDMAHLLRTSITRKISLNLGLERSLPLVEADVSQMQQIVMNLITNASEAIGDEHGVIALSTGQMECTEDYLADSLAAAASAEEERPPGNYVFFEVRDTGCGMDEETKAKIFDPFFTTKFTGRGLGMAAVLGIVRGHKGAIVLDTAPGKGTTFRVLFPAIEGRVAKASENGPDEEQGQNGTKAQGTVLVVDDERSVRDLTTKILERQGFTVLTAVNGQQAVDVFREHTSEIVCVLLDLTMPVMGGERAFDELRAIRPDVRVILSSGYDEEEISQRFAGRDLAGFIQKPYQSADLVTKVSEVLGE